MVSSCICRVCIMLVTGCKHEHDLILLDVVISYVIRGMNWLARIRAMIDCCAHCMAFVMPDYNSRVTGCLLGELGP